MLLVLSPSSFTYYSNLVLNLSDVYKLILWQFTMVSFVASAVHTVFMWKNAHPWIAETGLGMFGALLNCLAFQIEDLALFANNFKTRSTQIWRTLHTIVSRRSTGRTLISRTLHALLLVQGEVIGLADKHVLSRKRES